MKYIHYEGLRRILNRILRNVNTDQTIKRLEREREFIRNINQLVLTCKDYKDFCNALFFEFRKVIDFDYCSVVSRIESTGEYYTYFSDFKQNTHDFRKFGELTVIPERIFYEEVLKSRKIIIKNNVYKNSSDNEKLRLNNDEVTSYMTFPLFIQDVLVGCISIVSRSYDYFTEIQQDLLSQVSAQVIVTLMNAMLLDNFTVSKEKYQDPFENAPEIILKLENLLKEKILKLNEAEKEICNQKKFLDALIQNTNVYVVMITAKGKIAFVNRAIEKKFEYPLREIIGKSVVDIFIPQENMEKLLDDIQLLLSGTCGEQIEIPFVTRDRQIRDILWNVTYFKDELGVLTNINLFGYDITEQNIMKEQLIQADKMSSLGTMISGVAHELNNPLSVIINFSELMMMYENLSESATRRLQHIIDASRRCAHIVENLLKFATKRKAIRKEQYVCINDVLKEALELVIHSFQVNNIEVEESLSKALPKTVADRVQLMQVFINLMNNAQDSMKDDMKSTCRKAVLSLRTFQKRDKIVIEFEDTGPGIQDPEKLFTPFYTTKEIGKGTGLGLAVSYGIIKEHGGTIVGSNGQKGAVFTITLPIKEQINKEIKFPVIKRDYNLSGLQILLVEDEISIAESCSEFLTEKGCHLTSVPNAKDAVLAIQKEHFDIVIMDLKMPGEMSGIQLYEWMMGNAPSLKGKVIVMTGDALSSESRTFIEKSRTNVIPKPFRFNDLLDKIYCTMSRDR